MNATTQSIDPAVLRPKLHESIEQLRDEELGAVHKLLLELEARRLMNELGEAFGEDWQSGRLTSEKVQEVVLEHRQKQPYR